MIFSGFSLKLGKRATRKQVFKPRLRYKYDRFWKIYLSMKRKPYA